MSPQEAREGHRFHEGSGGGRPVSSGWIVVLAVELLNRPASGAPREATELTTAVPRDLMIS
jgi:hypothetical protein